MGDSVGELSGSGWGRWVHSFTRQLVAVLQESTGVKSKGFGNRIVHIPFSLLPL